MSTPQSPAKIEGGQDRSSNPMSAPDSVVRIEGSQDRPSDSMAQQSAVKKEGGQGTRSDPMSTRQNMVKTEGGQDAFYNLSTLLPTGTFLALQAVAPLFTNNGVCGRTERIVTALLVFTFTIINVLQTFTDSILVGSGKHYYGLVTRKGLYSPQFQKLAIHKSSVGSVYIEEDQYKINRFDFFNAVATVTVFNALVLLTPPVSQCFFPRISTTLNKCIPILVGIIAGLYFSFLPSPRKGVGYSLNGFVTDVSPDDDESEKRKDSPPPGTGAAQSRTGTQTQTKSTTPSPAAGPAAAV